ncbi:hypothetical protein ACT17_02845 [Mycolicibacterium conceptionense]|uniref:Uncharacterized protein n=2 Tax=Mycolicibacterium TaxID=1866885 RepID=A0ABR5FN00_9MYCO|nr:MULTISPECIES: hypothetical protein [Mycolicibacterium]KLI07909.1 hypothetical protein AA982_12440 [Mycolicibacterium senegalense]KLO48229.1 hypothetical protein ABW05_26295 [Mycolicibacterium senegalense]KMV20602.1 hypothetical protein ACT17_02845 [Mycolicibacterium conceptionense]OBJ97079.1 hypothetical protein A5639_30620 [Mycolicibacterium conceptionense]OMB68180.1 hypothetical protein A5741_09835 [Mycolicibacterium conceptionense]
MSTILTVVGGGIAGSALTYGLTWLRERRRTADAYRAPQRAAVGEISAATYELTLRMFAFRDVCENLVNQHEGKLHRQIPDEQEEETATQAQRALLGVGQAFQTGRLAVVDAECYEAMGAAFHNFNKVGEALSGVAELTPTAENMREKLAALMSFVRDLNRDVVALVKAGQTQLSPVQTWANKRRRKAAQTRLDAKYFKPPDVANTRE